MPDDPRLRMFLDMWETDVAEGKTVRALHERLVEHQAQDERRFEGLGDRISDLGERMVAAEVRAETNGKSSRRLNDLRSPTPPKPAPEWLSKALEHTATKVFVLVASAIVSGTAGFLVRHLFWH